MFLEKISCILAIFISIWVELAADMVRLWQQEYLLYKRPIRASNILRIIVVHIYTCITNHLREYKETYLDLCREWDKQENRGSKDWMSDYLHGDNIIVEHVQRHTPEYLVLCLYLYAIIVLLLFL